MQSPAACGAWPLAPVRSHGSRLTLLSRGLQPDDGLPCFTLNRVPRFWIARLATRTPMRGMACMISAFQPGRIGHRQTQHNFPRKRLILWKWVRGLSAGFEVGCFHGSSNRHTLRRTQGWKNFSETDPNAARPLTGLASNLSSRSCFPSSASRLAISSAAFPCTFLRGLGLTWAAAEFAV
jgi:hypothetical protein